MKKSLFAGLLCASCVACAETLLLSGPGWTCDGACVSVPHTWNAVDGADGLGVPKGQPGHNSVSSQSYARELRTYRRALPDPKSGKRYFLRCDGVCEKAAVRVNGQAIGSHVGAFTAFCFEITAALKPTGNVLEIDADNRYDPQTPPFEADFTMYGGIYRNVWLLERAPVCIDPTVHGAEGVDVFPDARTGEVLAHVRVSGGTNEVQRFRFDNPKLWSPETPHLYTLDVAIAQGGHRDSVKVTFGFRTIAFREDGFYLNGKRRQIRGVCRHQDRIGKGWAVTAADEAQDVDWMKRMGADGVRTAHYPHSPDFYRLCDEKGILVWTEIPCVDHIPEGETFKRHAVACAREMVAQNRNHPSIIVWGAFNEIYQFKKPDGTAEPVLVAVREAIHAMDASRPVGGASNGNKIGLNRVPDVLGMNLYPGWYGNQPENMGAKIAEALEKNARACVGITEYGGGASVNHHDEPMRMPVWRSRFHPEEYQAWLHRGNYLGIKGNPRVWGSFAWVMFDLGSDSRQEGEKTGVNDKGLVTADRKTAKDAFYLYKCNWNPEPELRIVGQRRTTTTNETSSVVVFSNAGEVSFTLNGKPYGVLTPDAVMCCVWRDVPLKPGANELVLTSGGLTRRAVWTRLVP